MRPTAEAIFRLAQSAHAMGDAEAARRHVRTLVTDYPRSEAREEAERWLDRAGEAPPASDPPLARAEETEQRRKSSLVALSQDDGRRHNSNNSNITSSAAA